MQYSRQVWGAKNQVHRRQRTGPGIEESGTEQAKAKEMAQVLRGTAPIFFWGGALGEDFIRLSSIDFLCGIIYFRSFISESPALTTVPRPAVAKDDHGKVLDGSCIGIVR